MIEALKPGRIILLTTHSMEEADALADHVAILANGRLRAAGTPLFLKNKFGSGYAISLLVHPERVELVRALVARHLHGAQVQGALGREASVRWGERAVGRAKRAPEANVASVSEVATGN
jgi:ABC-type multidrug transport system ATPase subunit